MRTANFRASVDEIRRNGGRRQAMYIREAWRDREMTVFTYSDNTAEVFEDAHPYMAFNSEARQSSPSAGCSAIMTGFLMRAERHSPTGRRR